jgi:ABC-type branched-subunit amino acid transport system substrate-binding protein
MEIDVSGLEPVVAVPHLPSNVKFVREVKDVTVDQAYLGSCTNGRIEDLRIAAQVMKNRTVANGTRMIVVPATTEIWKQANREGLLDIFHGGRGNGQHPQPAAPVLADTWAFWPPANAVSVRPTVILSGAWQSAIGSVFSYVRRLWQPQPLPAKSATRVNIYRS